MIKVLFLLILFPLNTIAQTILKGKVVSVRDGDTIEMLLEGNSLVRIRLAAIDCPEYSQAFGTKAKQFTSDKCFGKIVIARQTDVDRYNRIIAFVYLPDSTILNEQLLRNGLAWHYKKYSQDKTLAKIEKIARETCIGLWSEKDPIAPWEFRYSKK